MQRRLSLQGRRFSEPPPLFFVRLFVSFSLRLRDSVFEEGVVNKCLEIVASEAATTTLNSSTRTLNPKPARGAVTRCVTDIMRHRAKAAVSGCPFQTPVFRRPLAGIVVRPTGAMLRPLNARLRAGLTGYATCKGSLISTSDRSLAARSLPETTPPSSRPAVVIHFVDLVKSKDGTLQVFVCLLRIFCR